MDFLTTLAEGSMPILYFMLDIRNAVLDFFFSIVTELGGEVFFLALAIIFFWCIDKRQGYFILTTGLIGTLLNQFAKLICRIERPWVIDPSYDEHIPAHIKEDAGGYSFPSGHTQSAAGALGSLAAYKPNGKKTAVCVSLILLVAFSRMYFGVHTLLDVSVSLLMSLLLVLALRPFFVDEGLFRRAMPYITALTFLIAAGNLVYVLTLTGDTTVDSLNYEHALKSGSRLLGCAVGVIVTYIVEARFNSFTTEARWYVQIIKLVLGLLGVLAIKEGLATPLELLFGNEMLARGVRYFLLVVFAGAVWPLTFGYFSKLKIGFMEKFSAWISEKTSKIFKKQSKKA